MRVIIGTFDLGKIRLVSVDFPLRAWTCARLESFRSVQVINPGNHYSTIQSYFTPTFMTLGHIFEYISNNLCWADSKPLAPYTMHNRPEFNRALKSYIFL